MYQIPTFKITKECAVFSPRNGEHWKFARSAFWYVTRRGETNGAVQRATEGAAEKGEVLCDALINLDLPNRKLLSHRGEQIVTVFVFKPRCFLTTLLY